MKLKIQDVEKATGYKIKTCIGCNKLLSSKDFVKNSKHKDGLGSYCKLCQRINNFNYLNKNRIKINKKRREKRKNNKLIHLLKDIRNRCNQVSDSIYKYYGGRGIECRITIDELKFLWFRDRAFEMKKPSISRKNHDDHYTLENCKFEELSKNIAERNKRVSSKAILQFDLEGNFIREWNSLAEASETLQCFNITNVLKGRYKQDKGFIWRYKNEN